jgi:DNA-binding IclR family transcriptional regulator
MTINQSLAHGLEILFLYDTSHQVYTVTEVSKLLGYSQSKTYRLVRTLIKYGFLQEENGTVQYSLGLNALHLGLLAQKQFNISMIARPLMGGFPFGYISKITSCKG